MRFSFVMFRLLRNLLQSLQVPVTNEYLRNLILEQLYHGSIQTITEILNDLNVESKVYQLEEKDLQLLECPVIVHFKKSENKFVVVVELHDEDIKYYDPIKNKYIRETKTLFFEKWTGVVLIPFTDERSGDPDYLKHTQEECKEKLINTGIYAGIFVGIFLLFIQILLSHPHEFLIWLPVFLVKIIALFVVLQILKIELGESNSFITKVCKTTDCGKVLHSKASKLFSWLSMGDLGVIYFGMGTFLLMIAPFINELASIVYLLFFLNLFTLPYTIFSISYQRFILKTWCPFCLMIMGILWVEFFFGLTVAWTEIFPLSAFMLLLFGLVAIATSIGWVVLKTILNKANLSESMRKYVNIIKKDTKLFKAVLSTENYIQEFISNTEIVLGNKEAENVLIAVISPYCPSCAVLYQSIKIFLTSRSDLVKVILRFKTEDRENGWDNQIIEYLLTFSINNMKEKALLILEKWYSMENKNLDLWKKKCEIEHVVVSNEAKQMRKEYHNWFFSAEIQGAPAMILNNKLVPRYYTFDDIKYFLKRI